VFAGGVGGDALCAVLDVPDLPDVMLLCLPEVSGAMRCVLICTQELVDVPEAMRSVCMLKAVEVSKFAGGGDALCATLNAGGCGGFEIC